MANINKIIVFGKFFLDFSNVDIKFIKKKLALKTNAIKKTFLIIPQV